MSETAVWRRGDVALLDELRQAQETLSAQYGRLLVLVAEMLNRGLAPAKGYADPVRLLQDLQRISKAEAARRVDHAKALASMVSVTGVPLPPACRPPPWRSKRARSGSSTSRRSGAP